MKKEIYISKGVGETRIAVKENGKLAELHVDKQSQVKTVGNIYKGIVENVIPGMQAAIALHEFSAFLSYVTIALHVGASLYSRYKGEGIWNAMVPVFKEKGKNYKIQNRNLRKRTFCMGQT